MKSKKLFSYKKSKLMQDTALRMALYCVRNTVIEDYHTKGKITDSEMMTFNKEVANKLYTFLELISNPSLEREREIAFTRFHRPDNWDIPQFDSGLQKAIENISALELHEKSGKPNKDFVWLKK